MKDFITTILAVGIFLAIYLYIYPQYVHVREVCTNNVHKEEVFGVVPVYYIAIGNEWNTQVATQTVDFAHDTQEPTVEEANLRGSYDSQKTAIHHCMIYFSQYNRQNP